MQRVAFKMKLLKGCEAEYKKRHDEIWPELKLLLKKTGIENYAIFLDENTSNLFGCLLITDRANLDLLPQEPIMKKWWNFMQDIMETNEDNSPLVFPLKEVFYLP